jgi:hypothetical protein
MYAWYDYATDGYRADMTRDKARTKANNKDDNENKTAAEQSGNNTVETNASDDATQGTIADQPDGTE